MDPTIKSVHRLSVWLAALNKLTFDLQPPHNIGDEDLLKYGDAEDVPEKRQSKRI